MEGQTLGSKLSSANVANQRLWLADWLVGLILLFGFLGSCCTSLAAFDMLLQTLWQEGSTTTLARHKHVGVVVVESSLVDCIYIVVVNLASL